MFDNQTLCGLFCKKLPFNKFFCRISNAMFDIMQKILQDVTKAKCRVVNGMESNGLNRLSWIKGIVEQGLGHLFISPSSSYFFNKIDFKQFLFKWENIKRVFRIFLFKLHCKINLAIFRIFLHQFYSLQPRYHEIISIRFTLRWGRNTFEAQTTVHKNRSKWQIYAGK